MKVSSITAAIESRRRDTEIKVGNLRAAVQRMLKAREPINFRAVASAAGVSRTFLYDYATARTLVAEAISIAGTRRHQRHASSSPTLAAWRERALNAEHTLQTATSEIQAQRTQIRRLLGQLRDFESELPPEAMQRIHSDNLDLKHQVEELTASNEQLIHKLKTSRENGRFQDRRIAELEATILEARTTDRLRLAPSATPSLDAGSGMESVVLERPIQSV